MEVIAFAEIKQFGSGDSRPRPFGLPKAIGHILAKLSWYLAIVEDLTSRAARQGLRPHENAVRHRSDASTFQP